MRVESRGFIKDESTKALIQATGARVTCTNSECTSSLENDERVFWFVNGFKLPSYRHVGIHLLNEVNAWLLHSGMVDVQMLQNITDQNGSHLFFVKS